MGWTDHELAAALAAGLRLREAELRDEQAVHGLDALSERELHPVLARGLSAAGLRVFPETPYPGQPEVLPRESERERCDLVLAPGGTRAIVDSIRRRKELDRASGTLFAPVAQQITAPEPGALSPEEAFWLEVKTHGQFTYTDGFAGPNRTYASQFGVCLTDIRKLARAPGIAHAALAIVLFTDERRTAEHDLAACVHRCLDKDLPVRDLIQEHVPIVDRIGNRNCTVGLIRVRCEPGDHPAAEI